MRLLAILLLAAAIAVAQHIASSAAMRRTVTVTKGTNIAATVSPDRRTIVIDLQGSLWAIPFQGGSARRLTDPLLEPARPDYSPKGDAIAFQAYQGGTFHIWTIKPDGSGLRQITNGHGDDREPRFSPDGSKIAFASDRAFNGSYDIWSFEVATGKLTQWTSAPADEYEPAWSPDGSEIAFVSGIGANGTTIQAVNSTGALRTLCTAAPGAHVDSPAWSPDGKRVAYTQIAAGKSRLMVDGSGIGTDDDVFPFPATWLSGDRILYTGNGKIQATSLETGATSEVPFEASFALNRPAYTRKHFDLDSTASKTVKGIVSPVLSPGGNQIVFESLNQLWLMEIGGRPRPLTSDRYYKEDPAWSPDGKRIAYSSDKSGIENIYILDLSNGAERRITSSTNRAEVGAAWSPDGKKLAFQDQAGATYVLDLDRDQERMVIPAQFAPSRPSWSASGTSISIAALKPYSKRFREGTSQILTANLATRKLTFSEAAPFLSLSTRGEDGPVYSPDGSSVAFVMGSVLWIRPVDRDGIPTGPGHAINQEATDAPTWSGDSKRLLYLSNGKLRLISTDGSKVETVPLDLTWSYEPAAESTLIHAGHLWDGRGAAVRDGVDIVVVNHRIRSIEPHKESLHRAAEANHDRFVDASSLTVIPGLWESHTHEWISGKFYGDRLGRLWLAYGVTELQSQGDPDYRAAETREAFGSGERVGPRFFASGEALDGERVYYNFMRPTYSEAQLQLELSRARALDYDLLKMYVRLPHALQQKAMEFAHSQMGVVAASHYMLPGMAYGMDGMTHVSATSRLGFAYTRTLAGVSYQDVRSLFQASGMFVISTPFQSFPLYAEDPAMVDDVRLATLNTPWDQAGLRAKRDMALGKPAPASETVRSRFGDVAATLEGLRKEEDTVIHLVRAGVLVLAGTDSPLDNVATALHLNLRAQVKFGLEPWQALQTATLLPARAFGVDRDLGTVEPGKLADLVLVAGDPLRNLRDLANVEAVMKSGKLYRISDLVAPFQHLGQTRR
ncbi:MAG TPA: amidohydrolase family protein [Bryobacteraceae bacterium]|nr:amidohydrolase family protein [Bryobacteraceae bacterium]